MKASNNSVVYGVLQDELERNRRMQARYHKEIEQLPKGSLFQRKIGDHQYYYLNYRDQSRVVSKYLGKLDDKNVEAMKKQVAERKHYNGLLKKLRDEENMLMKVLR